MTYAPGRGVGVRRRLPSGVSCVKPLLAATNFLLALGIINSVPSSDEAKRSVIYVA